MLKQKFYTVWRNNDEWFDFPQSNEQGVTDMLMQKGIMQECIILPQGEVPHKVKVVTANSNAVIEKLKDKDKEIEELKKQLAQQMAKATPPQPSQPTKTVTPSKTK